MSDSELSISSVSALKAAEISQQAEVAVFKKALDQQGAVTTQLIQSATSTPLPPGKGGKLNTSA